MRRKSLLNEKAIIILSLNQSECRKLLRSASSRIGFSRDTGMEASACKSSCRPLFLAIRRRSSLTHASRLSFVSMQFLVNCASISAPCMRYIINI